MKKVILLLVVFALCITGLGAQEFKEGAFNFLNGEQKLHLVIDYNNAIIHDKTEAAFVNQMVAKNGELWKDKWEEITKKELYQHFSTFFNRWTAKTGIQIGDFPEANYVATVKIMKIEKKGTTYANVLFSMAGSTDVIAITSVQGKGGKRGSVENRMGDGFKRTGYHLGRIFTSNLKSPLPTVQTGSVNTPSATVDSIVFVKPQPVEILQVQPAQLPPQKRRQLPQATLKANAGYGWRIVKINPDLDEFERNIVSNLLHGFAWNANFDYFFKDKFGIRMIFSQYISTYNTMAQDLNTGQQGTLNAKDAITYVGPAFVFRQPFGQNRWIFDAHTGFGYIDYRQNIIFANQYEKINGSSLGTQMGVGLECKVAQNVGIGINILITSGTINNFKIDANGNKSTEKFEAGGEGLLQIKLGAGIRYYIK
jgi:hypothetical protein